VAFLLIDGLPINLAIFFLAFFYPDEVIAIVAFRDKIKKA
jgi:hypothetical protein